MDRLKGFASFIIVAAVVAVGLRLVHVVVPIVFPETRLGPIAVANLDEVRPRVGFVPLIPAYHPAALGGLPVSMSVVLSPTPTFAIVWRQGEQYLSVTERKGGPKPDSPPLAGPLTDVAGSTWWMADSRCHLLLARDDLWIEIETSLPSRELKRFADTLTPYKK